VITGTMDKVYVIERNADTYSEILYDHPIPKNDQCIYLDDSEHGNFLCKRYGNKLYYSTYHIVDSLDHTALLEDTKKYGDYLFDEYASPELWQDTLKEYRLVTVNGEYTTSIARYSAMHSYGRAYKYFFLGIREEDGKTVMYEVSNTNQDYVTDTVVSFFEGEDEIITFELDAEKYDVVNGFYIPKLMEGNGFLVAPYNQMVGAYTQAAKQDSMDAMPFKYIDIEPLYYYTDGTLTNIYIHIDRGSHTITHHFPVNSTSYTSATLDEKLLEDGKCLALDRPGGVEYTLCREGDTLYHTTK